MTFKFSGVFKIPIFEQIAKTSLLLYVSTEN
jgi:hypothetical protein